jgi:hypothetical protein
MADEIEGWFVLRIKIRMMKKTVELRVNIMAVATWHHVTRALVFCAENKDTDDEENSVVAREYYGGRHMTSRDRCPSIMPVIVQ